MSSSPSASLKYPVTSTLSVPPAATEWSGIVPWATGGVFELSPSPTVTLMGCEALAPSGSLAVTVTTAIPSATPLIVATAPSTEVVAASSFDEAAA